MKGFIHHLKYKCHGNIFAFYREECKMVHAIKVL